MSTTLRLSGPIDVISALPYQLGFQPTRCLVVVCITRNNLLGLIQRIDLPQEAEVEVATLSLAPALRDADPRSVLLVGYEDDKGEALPMVSSVAGLVSGMGIRVSDAIVVRNGRWYATDCTDPECCPPEGTPLPESPAIAAEYVARGVAPLPDRQALERSIETSPENLQVAAEVAKELERQFEAMREAGSSGEREEEKRQIYVEATEAWGRILTGTEDLRHDDVAAATLIVNDLAYRDALMAYMTPGMLSDDLVDTDTKGYMALLPTPTWVGSEPATRTVQHRLVTMCSLLPDEVATAPLTILGSYTWWRGDGALTTAALNRALRCNPEYRLAQLLSQMVALGIRPNAKETA